MGGPRRVRLRRGRRPIFGDTVDFVLSHAPCRVHGRRRARGGRVNGAVPQRVGRRVRRCSRSCLGVALLAETARAGRRLGRLPARRALPGARLRAPLPALRAGSRLRAAMARKLPRLQRVLDAPALASVAYGEIASSIYFALGIVALHALGLTPVVLGVVGLLFLVVALSYAEGTTSIPRDRRRRDLRPRRVQRLRRLHHRLGALPRLPDRDRALGALLPALPRARARDHSIAHHPGDVIVGCDRDRGDRRRRGSSAARASTRSASWSPLLDLVTQLAARRARLRVPLLGERAHARARPRHAARRGTRSPSRCRSRCSRTRASRRSRTSPRRRAQPGPRPAAQPLHRDRRASSSITVLIALVALSAFPAPHGTTQLGTTLAARAADGDRLRARAARRLVRSDARCAIYVGLTGALVLLVAADDLDLRLRAARLLARRARPAAARASAGSPPDARLAAVGRRRGADLDRAPARDGRVLTNPVVFLASLFSFGVLRRVHRRAARGVRLRFTQPELERPFRVAARRPHPRRRTCPLPSLVGALRDVRRLRRAMVTHIGARYGGPAWLAAGSSSTSSSAATAATGLLEHVEPAAEPSCRETEFSQILVPMKLGRDRRGDDRDRGQARAGARRRRSRRCT